MNYLRKIRSNIYGRISSPKFWFSTSGRLIKAVFGFALTFGITEWGVDRYHDRKRNQEMVHHILKAANDNYNRLVKIDSIFTDQGLAIYELKNLYKNHNGDLSKVRRDSLFFCLDRITCMDYLIFAKAQPERYFNNPDVLRQFNNANVYTDFSSFIEFDKQTFEIINSLQEEWHTLFNRIQYKSSVKNVGLDALIQEVFEEQILTDYFYNICFKGNLKTRISMYKTMLGVLYKDANISSEEYNDFISTLEKNGPNLIKEEKELMLGVSFKETKTSEMEYYKFILEHADPEEILIEEGPAMELNPHEE